MLHEFVEVLPAPQRIDTDWYRVTADAIYQNLDIVNTHNPEFVLILSGDHVYKMDYGIRAFTVRFSTAAAIYWKTW